MEDFQTIEEAEPKKKKGFRGFFIKLIIVVILLGGVGVWWKFYYTYSDGFRTGILQKLSHKGNFAKTYEGELILSSVISSNNIALASEKFYFSVPSDSIAKEMMIYEGKSVRIHYEQKKGKLPWRGESTYLVDGVQLETEIVEPPMLVPPGME